MRATRYLRLLVSVAVACAALAWVPPPADAHLDLITSEPAAGAKIDGSPTRVLLTFTSEPDVPKSSIRVLDAQGARVKGVAKAEGVASDPLQLSADVRSALPPGRYTIKWKVVSADGHTVSGSVPFRVVAGTQDEGEDTAASPSPAVAPSAAASATPSPEGVTTAGGSGRGTLILAANAVLLAGVAAAGVVLVKRRSRRRDA